MKPSQYIKYRDIPAHGHAKKAFSSTIRNDYE